MAGVFDVMIDTGGSDDNPGANTVLTNLRYNVADDNDQDSGNPVPIPAAGTEYSFMKQIYLKCTTAPSVKADTFVIYTDGGDFGTGVTVKAGDETPTNNTGSNAGYELATAAVEMVADNANLTGSTDLFTFTSGSAKSVSVSEASSQIDAIGELTDYVVLQMEAINTASHGLLSAETITYAWQEI